MTVDHRQVLGDRRPALGRGVDRPAHVPADVGGAELGDVLDRLDVVAVGQEREQGEGMIRGDGDASFSHCPAGEDRRHRFLGLLADADGIAIPDAVGLQAGEVGQVLGIQAAVPAHQGGGRQLVEDQHDQRRRAGGSQRLGYLRPGQEEDVGGGGGEGEPQAHHQRGDSQIGDPGPNGA